MSRIVLGARPRVTDRLATLGVLGWRPISVGPNRMWQGVDVRGGLMPGIIHESGFPAAAPRTLTTTDVRNVIKMLRRAYHNNCLERDAAVALGWDEKEGVVSAALLVEVLRAAAHNITEFLSFPDHLRAKGPVVAREIESLTRGLVRLDAEGLSPPVNTNCWDRLAEGSVGISTLLYGDEWEKHFDRMFAAAIAREKAAASSARPGQEPVRVFVRESRWREGWEEVSSRAPETAGSTEVGAPATVNTTPRDVAPAPAEAAPSRGAAAAPREAEPAREVVVSPADRALMARLEAAGLMGKEFIATALDERQRYKKVTLEGEGPKWAREDTAGLFPSPATDIKVKIQEVTEQLGTGTIVIIPGVLQTVYRDSKARVKITGVRDGKVTVKFIEWVRAERAEKKSRAAASLSTATETPGGISEGEIRRELSRAVDGIVAGRGPITRKLAEKVAEQMMRYADLLEWLAQGNMSGNGLEAAIVFLVEKARAPRSNPAAALPMVEGLLKILDNRKAIARKFGAKI